MVWAGVERGVVGGTAEDGIDKKSVGSIPSG